jgi:cation:H+ antiporter
LNYLFTKPRYNAPPRIVIDQETETTASTQGLIILFKNSLGGPHKSLHNLCKYLMITSSIAIIIGFIGLIWSADRFVLGAAAIARNWGMAPIMIGLTIVALGTSAPEIIVSISASLNHSAALAVGNALGSNLANIGMVLGITAVIAPLPIARHLLKREIPLLIAATLGAGLCLMDNHLSVMDGALFLIALGGIFYVLTISKSHQPDAEHEADVEHIPELPTNKAWIAFIIGLVLLVGSSQILVWGAKEVATALGVSELIIGLTVVAVGTSLPELAATVASAIKGHHDIAIGNVIGSNLFNLLAVMAMPALISQPELNPEVFSRDYAAMTAITLFLALLLFGHIIWSKLVNGSNTVPKHRHIGRLEGALLLFAYAAYYYYLFPS